MSHDNLPEGNAERGREIIAQLREIEAQDRAAYEAFSSSVKSKNKKFIRRRRTAAAMVAEAIGADYSDESLRRSNCPFVVIHKVALYSDDDLRELAESILDSATVRRGPPAKRRRVA
jgi:hypothetical protein